MKSFIEVTPNQFLNSEFIKEFSYSPEAKTAPKEGESKLSRQRKVSVSFKDGTTQSFRGELADQLFEKLKKELVARGA